MEKEKIWNKGFTTVTIAHTLLSVGMYMITPTLPLFLVSLGAVESQVGLVVTAFYISSIVTRFLLNAVLIKVGKKRVLLIGVSLNVIAMSLYGVTGSIGVVAALHVIQGVGLGAFSVSAATLAVDFLPDSRRGEGVGYFTMGVVLAMAAAPALALHMRSNYGFLPMFLVAAFTNLASVIIVSFIREPKIVKAETVKNTGVEEKQKFFELRNLYDSRLITASIFVLLFGMCRSVDLNYITLFAEEKNLDHLSWFYVIQTASMFLVRLIAGRISDRKGRNWLLIPGGIFMLATTLTLSLTNSSAMLLLGALFSGLGVGIMAPNLQLWLLSIVEPERRVVASASYFSFVEIGSAIAAPLMGYMAQNYGYASMFQTAAGAAMVYIIGYMTIGREKRRRSMQSS